jgi:hypothetical protein
MQRVGSLLSERWSRIFLAGASVALIAALVVGVSDNPPGVMLAYLASACLVAAFTTRWRRPRPFLMLAGWGIVGFVVSAVLHNVFDALAQLGGALPVVPSLAVGVGVTFFFLAVLVAPAAVIVGLVGALRSWLQGKGTAAGELSHHGRE